MFASFHYSYSQHHGQTWPSDGPPPHNPPPRNQAATTASDYNKVGVGIVGSPETQRALMVGEFT